jgi:hypothetical protein
LAPGVALPALLLGADDRLPVPYPFGSSRGMNIGE